MDKKELYAYIDENKGIFEELSDKIWGFAEISLKEHESAKAYKALLEELGFKVETGLAGNSGNTRTCPVGETDRL